MSQIERAMSAGQLSLAVTGALLRDANVMLALKERGALHPMALSGKPVAPVIVPGDKGIARAIASKGGVLAIVEPGPADQVSLQKLAQMLSTAPNKPTIVVVGKSFNALAFSMMFRGMKVEHIKARGKSWLEGLPIPAADQAPLPEVPKAKARKTSTDSGPRFCFVGRDEEVEALKGHLSTGGSTVIVGPRGIGKTYLIENVLADDAFKRLPDLVLGRGVGFDALIARIAEIAKAGGSDALATLLAGEHTPKQAIEAAIEALQAAEGTEGQVMVVEGLQFASGREGDFFRKSRLELLAEALLTNAFPLRIVWTSVVAPRFFRESRTSELKVIELGGIKGRFYHDIFSAYGAGEVDRDKFGGLSEKLHGNPFAVRTAAIAIRHTPNLIDNEKFFRLSGIDDRSGLSKQVEKRVSKLPDRAKAQIKFLAHVRYPVDGQVLSKLGINRKDRMFLLSEGVLDMIGTESGSKRYQVHSLVRSTFSAREVADFDILEEVGNMWRDFAGKAEGVEALAADQEANRCFQSARKYRSMKKLAYADSDAVVDSTFGLLRSKSPRFDLAERRIGDVLKGDASNSDAYLQKLEMLRKTDAKNADVKPVIEEALSKALVPEVVHEVVGIFLKQNARNKAIKVLEDAVTAFPDQSRLKTRLGALLLRAGRRADAVDLFRQAMDLDPLLPDAYGLLGMARREEGTLKLDEAENLLREAVRLAPGDLVQTSRLVGLLLDIAKGVPERAEAAREEVANLLEELLQMPGNKESHEVHLLWAVALREQGTDLERAAWFLKKARKYAPRNRSILSRLDVEDARLLVAQGKLGKAEKLLKQLGRKEPQNHRVFAALATVFEAMGQNVAAHAELARACDRVSPHSLDRQSYETEMKRLQALIEAGAGLVDVGTPAEAPAAAPEAAPAEEAAAPEAAPAEEAAAPEAAPAEEAAAPEAAPAEESSEEESAEESADEDKPADA